MFDLTPPRLETLNTKPSWLNRAGRIDRSACLELRCSDIWPLARPASAGRRSTFTLSLPRLLRLLDSRRPRLTTGDHRTRKSNALKHPRSNTALSHVPDPLSLSLHPTSDITHPTFRTLALPSSWSQTFTIERHRLHSMLAQHFFVCPSCGKSINRGERRVRKAKKSSACIKNFSSSSSSAISAPSAVKSRIAVKSPSLPGCFLKLFLILPTLAEYRDALIARLWLNSNHQITKAPHHQIAMPLIERYGLLFPDRRFLCRHCLGIRYGYTRSLKPAPINPAYANLTPEHWRRLIKLDNLRLAIANDRRRFKDELAALDDMMSDYPATSDIPHHTSDIPSILPATSLTRSALNRSGFRPRFTM